MPYYVPVADTPEMQRVRENQKNFSMVRAEIKKNRYIFYLQRKLWVNLYSTKLTFDIFPFHSFSISQTYRTVKERSQWYRTPQKSWGWRRTRRISARYGHLCLHFSAQKIEFNIFNKITIFGASPTDTVDLAGLYKLLFPAVFVGWLASFTGTAVMELIPPVIKLISLLSLFLCAAPTSVPPCPSSCSVCLSRCPVPVAMKCLKSPVAFCLQHH